MRILRVQIENFRSIESLSLDFSERMLIVGDNNAGKTTLLEALDLVLGPEKVRGGDDEIDEHDFYRSEYRTALPNEDGIQEFHYPDIKIEVILGNLTEGETSRFHEHLEPWDPRTFTISVPTDDARAEQTEFVLRVAFNGSYDPEEDEFRSATYFSWPEPEDRESIAEYETFTRSHKRVIGFLYLRSLRTARRAASLQRHSLLDILLKLRKGKANIWEEVLANLRKVGLELADGSELKAVIVDLQKRLGRFLPKNQAQPLQSQFHVGRLTRESLRDQMLYFLETGFGDHSLPYDNFGAGTVNILVLALLSAIADAKQNVIFAMEEPEIAVPPHTQRRIVKEIFKASAQALVTSHSPYIAEQFLDYDIVTIRRAERCSVGGRLSSQSSVKLKELRRDFRIKYAEGLMAKGVIVVEGISEVLAIGAVDRRLSSVENTCYLPLDLSGVVVVDGNSGPGVAKTARFYSSLGIPVFPILDHDKRQSPEAGLDELEGMLLAHQYTGLEKLAESECDLAHIKNFLKNSAGANLSHRDADDPSSDKEARAAAFEAWRKHKGDGILADFFESLPPSELPPTLVKFLLHVLLFTRLGEKIPADDPLTKVFPADLIGEFLDQPASSPNNSAPEHD